MYYERCEICGNRWQRIPTTMVARDSKTTLNNRTARSSTEKRPVQIERPFLSTRTREHDDAGHASTESLYWECSTCSTTSRLSLDGCDFRLVDQGILKDVDANLVPIGEDDSVPQNA